MYKVKKTPGMIRFTYISKTALALLLVARVTKKGMAQRPAIGATRRTLIKQVQIVCPYD
jgi:hypothetical protein